jgi:hypothetical protein
MEISSALGQDLMSCPLKSVLEEGNEGLDRVAMEFILHGASQKETSPSDLGQKAHLYDFQIFTSKMQ